MVHRCGRAVVTGVIPKRTEQEIYAALFALQSRRRGPFRYEDACEKVAAKLKVAKLRVLAVYSWLPASHKQRSGFKAGSPEACEVGKRVSASQKRRWKRRRITRAQRAELECDRRLAVVHAREARNCPLVETTEQVVNVADHADVAGGEDRGDDC